MFQSEMTDPMRRFKAHLTTTLAAVAAAAAVVWLSSCGDFWQNPYGTNGGGTTTTTTTLSAPATATVGTNVTLTATVSPSTATGTVTFYNGADSIGSGTLSSGTATSTASFTAAGSESLTATYGGSSTYASSTSGAVTVTVSTTAAADANHGSPKVSPSTSSNAKESSGVTTNTNRVPAIHATRAFTADGGSFTAKDAEAAIVEDNGSVILNDTALSATNGNGRGILLYQSSASSGEKPSFTMTRGSIAYTCDAVSTPACAEGSTSKGQSHPATLFAIANTMATISLTDVEVTNDTSTSTRSNGTLLTAAGLEKWGTAGANGGHVAFQARGTVLAGDVIVDGISTARLSLLEDDSGTGSSLTGAVNSADTGKAVSLTLDPASLWIVTGTSYLTHLDGLDLKDKTVSNIDGGGHCIYYSGTIDGAKSTKVYALSGGGYLAPAGTRGLRCD